MLIEFVVLGLSLGVARPLIRCLRKARFRKLDILDSASTTLAESHLLSGSVEELRVEGEERPSIREAALNEEVLFVVGTEPIYSNGSRDFEPRTDGFTLDGEVSTIRRHRRIKRGRKGKYTSDLLADLKNRFGTPVRNAANLLAVRRAAVAMMNDGGLRPTHQRTILASLVEMVFVPDQFECEAEAWRSSALVEERRRYFASLGPSTGVMGFMDWLKANETNPITTPST